MEFERLELKFEAFWESPYRLHTASRSFRRLPEGSVCPLRSDGLLHGPEQRIELACELPVADEARAVDRLALLADVDAGAGEAAALIAEVLDDAGEEQGVGDEQVEVVVEFVDDPGSEEVVDREVGGVDDPLGEEGEPIRVEGIGAVLGAREAEVQMVERRHRGGRRQ